MLTKCNVSWMGSWDRRQKVYQLKTSLQCSFMWFHWSVWWADMLKTFKLTYTVVKLGPQVIFTTYLPELSLFSIPKGHNSFKARTLYKIQTIWEQGSRQVWGRVSQQHPTPFLGLSSSLSPPVIQSTSDLIGKIRVFLKVSDGWPSLFSWNLIFSSLFSYTINK